MRKQEQYNQGNQKFWGLYELKKRLNLKTKYQICNHKVYLQVAQGTCSLVFPQSTKNKKNDSGKLLRKV